MSGSVIGINVLGRNTGGCAYRRISREHYQSTPPLVSISQIIDCKIMKEATTDNSTKTEIGYKIWFQCLWHWGGNKTMERENY